MKKLLSMLLIVTMLLSTVLIAIPVINAAPAGTGITDLSQITSGAQYYLKNDIYVYEDTNGEDKGGLYNFVSGATLDGNGYKIILGTAEAPVVQQGVFGWAANATFKNIILEGYMTVSGSYAGPLSNGFDQGCTMENVKSNVNITVTGDTSGVGGVIGKVQNYGTINMKNVSYTGTITVNEGVTCTRVGGIISMFGNEYNSEFAKTATFSNCYFEGKLDVKGNAEYVGGILGSTIKKSDAITFDACVVSGDINVVSTGNGCKIGGLVGYVSDTGSVTVKNCVVAGGTITSSATATSYIGGLVGFVYGSIPVTIDSCVTIPNADGDPVVNVLHAAQQTYAGGILGMIQDNYSTVVVKNCVNTADVVNKVSGPWKWMLTGGIVGSFSRVKDAETANYTIANCHNQGDVTGWWAGGILGGGWQLQSSKLTINIEYCTNDGDIYGRFQLSDGSWKGETAAGIVSNLQHNQEGADSWMPNNNGITLNVIGCINNGDVNGRTATAGILALNECGQLTTTILNCANTGAITSAESSNIAAGIVSSTANTLSVVRCVNTGAATNALTAEALGADSVGNKVTAGTENTTTTQAEWISDWDEIITCLTTDPVPSTNSYWMDGAPYIRSDSEATLKAFEGKVITQLMLPVHTVTDDSNTGKASFTLSVITNDTNKIVRQYTFNIPYADAKYGLVKGANNNKEIVIEVSDYFPCDIYVGAGETLGFAAKGNTLSPAWGGDGVTYSSTVCGFVTSGGSGAEITLTPNGSGLPVNVAYDTSATVLVDANGAQAAIDVIMAEIKSQAKNYGATLVYTEADWTSKPTNKNVLIMNDITLTQGQSNWENGAPCTVFGLGNTITFSGATSLVPYGEKIVIRDLKLEGSVTQTSFSNAGVISNHGIQKGGSRIENVVSNVDLNVTGAGAGCIGGLIGKCDGASDAIFMKNVTNNGDTIYTGSGASTVGGIIGKYVSNTRFENVVNNGEVKINGAVSWGTGAGIVGNFQDDGGDNAGNSYYTFVNVVNNGPVSTNQALPIGGIASKLPGDGGRNNAWFINCANNGSVTTTARGNVGGILAQSDNAHLVMNGCVNSGALTATFGKSDGHTGIAGMVGTIVGQTASIVNCENTATGDITFNAPEGVNDNSNTQVGGIVGRVNWCVNIAVKDCTNEGDITVNWPQAGWDSAAGIIGGYMTQNNALDLVVEDCVNTGNIVSPGPTGGIFGGTAQLEGDNIKFTFKNCANFGDVTSVQSYAGGIFAAIGVNHAYTSGVNNKYKFVKADSCLNAGDVQGLNIAGGIGGYCALAISAESAITNSVNAGHVDITQTPGRTGNAWVKVGGIIGDFGNKITLAGNVHLGTLTTVNGTSNLSTFPMTNGVETGFNGGDHYNESWFDGMLLNDTYTTYESLNNIYLAGSATQTAVHHYSSGAAMNRCYYISSVATEAQVDARLKEMAAVGFDSDTLKAVIAAKADLVEADYTAASWAVYTEAVNAAIAVLDTYEDTDYLERFQYTLNDAEAVIATAKNNLISIKALKETIALAKAEKQYYYTTDSWNAMTEKLTAAETALTATTQEAVDTAKNELATAIENLEEDPSSGALFKAIDTATAIVNGGGTTYAEGKKVYTITSWNLLNDELSDANGMKDQLVDNPAITPETIKPYTDALNKAIDELVELDMSKLNASYTGKTADIDGKYYVDETWAAYDDARTAAYNILTSGVESQKTIDDALVVYDMAFGALALKTVTTEQMNSVHRFLYGSDEYSYDSYVEEYYDADAWAAFEAAVDEARALTKYTTWYEYDLVQAKVQDAWAALENSKLLATEDQVTEFQNWLDELKSLTDEKDYYNGEAFDEYILEFEAWVDYTDITVEELAGYKAHLEDSAALLVELPSDETIIDVIKAEYETLDENDKVAVQMIAYRGVDYVTLLKLIITLKAD